MRYFSVLREDVPVAVVFHDHRDGSFCCRSRLESFLRAFNAMTEKSEIRFSKEEGVLRAVAAGSEDYNWAESLLDHLCTGHWRRGESGDIISTEANIDAVVSQILS